ncbi:MULTISPECIES: ArsA family ATPase [Cyanophyceae]|uniref:Get3/ArsA fold putative tail anchor-mediating ATPase NosAFP n=1 Tax=Cyanophyceae TaxID=3028117 RepID=UPI0016857FB7|nr:MULTISPECIES: ArsA family ATPase [Cyanophyceae]MBD1917079.1 ArsA family ATPase [Phormidium sp. FACHB-77]MBD2030610.1 ArsA family ATPase [Phormidium sp. FACHB-322]MBD2050282.1 ArsA family ATPase [Leptolyngbya sp. FACHB-60]
MALILTYLGKGGSGSTTVAIAAAKQRARAGQRVLLAIQDVTPAPALLLDQTLTVEPGEIEPNLWAMQFQSAALLEQSWDEVKALESQYLRTPFLKAVYGQELGVMPGMDSALALNTLRQLNASDRYDVIIYDGSDALATLRMLGMPEILDWYLRRFRGVFQQSDVGRVISPFLQPMAAAVLAVDWSGDVLDQPTGQVRSQLEEGRQAVTDPGRMAAFLVTTPTPGSVATARYLWGSAQQIGLTVGGVVVNGGSLDDEQATAFAPLPQVTLPSVVEQGWESAIAALPDPAQWATAAPRPVTIDATAKTVRLFLPSFDKTQVKLTQYGPEVTIEAGDQRRNLLLPPTLQGKAVAGAKFQDQHLVLSFS